MKFPSSNPNGLGNPLGFRALRDMLKKEDPDLVFHQETKVKASFLLLRNLFLVITISWGWIIMVKAGVLQFYGRMMLISKFCTTPNTIFTRCLIYDQMVISHVSNGL